MDLFFFACTACLCASDRVEGRAFLKKTRKVLGPENFSRRFFSRDSFWVDFSVLGKRFSKSQPDFSPEFLGLFSQVCSVRQIVIVLRT